MTFRKNWFSILIWIPFSLAVCGVFGFVLYNNLPQLSFITNEYLQLTFTVIVFLLAICIFAGIRKLSKRKILKNALIAEAFLFTILLGVGVLFRCSYLYNTVEPLTVLEETAYFDTAKITGGVIAPIAHGAQYFYVVLIRGLFWLFGNHFLIGIILQIVLQCLTCIVWYIVIRKISGFSAALIFMTGMMLLPKSILSGITYSPKYLYLLLAGIAMMFLANVLNDEYRNKTYRWYTWIARFILGTFIGLLIYMDVAGLLLLVPVFFIPFLCKDTEIKLPLKQKLCRVVSQIITIFLSTFLSWYAWLAIDAWQRGSSINEVQNVWFTLFSYKGMREIPAIFMHKQSVWAYIFILFLLVLGVFSFFARKKSENQLIWMFMLLAGLVVHFGGFYSSGMTCDELLFVLLLALTGAGVHALTQREFGFAQATTDAIENSTDKESEVMYQEFNTKQTMPPSTTTETTENVVLAVNEQVTDKNDTTTSQVAEKLTVEEKPKFIENPLPLPKKHVKKTMDYGIEIPPEQMEFDIETSDMDDFDVI